MIEVLVTGANGQLGKSIQKLAPDYPALHFVFKNSKKLDITDTRNVAEVFAQSKFDYCINCAAYTNVEQAEREPEKAFLVNAEGVKNLALACSSFNVTLIHISTDYVFDGEKETPYKPTDKPNPINIYGTSKLKGENYVKEILKKYFIIRTSWLYSEFGKNFYKTVLQKAKIEKVLHITDSQIGCPTKAGHLAKFILKKIQTDDTDFGIHHFTDNKVMTWYDFAILILNENGLGNTVKVVRSNNYTSFAKRPKNSALS